MAWLDLHEGVAELFLEAQDATLDDLRGRYDARCARERALAGARLARWRARHRDRLRAERRAAYTPEKRRARYDAQIAKHGREVVAATSRRAHAKMRANPAAHEAQKAQKRAYARARYAAHGDAIRARERARYAKKRAA